MNKSLKTLILDTIENCVSNGITLKLDKNKYTKIDRLKCSGYFCDESAILCTATGKEEAEWVPIFVHETCHLDQWLEKDPIWKIGSDAVNRLFDNLKPNGRISKKDVQNSILLERNCEVRSIKKIKKYNLNIDLDKYIQQSNLYLLSYWMVAKHKKWVTGIYDKIDYTQFPKKHLSIEEHLNNKNKYLELFKEFY